MPMLKAYCTDLTKLAEQGCLDPVIGREAQVARLIQILGRKSKNNACLVGEAGVGKTATADALAQTIANVPPGHALACKRVMSLDVARLVGGTRLKGEIEDRLGRDSALRPPCHSLHRRDSYHRGDRHGHRRPPETRAFSR
ncbi:hypothetical protein GOP47_0019643 [Adiantum capillus-veneris]|uniref:Orc1-like AAA ATPase domain-containing protein n=1 Tax=Adiantum capillus-veneris TaxID=13818 RepID=A0A9D4UBF4_ADICA|nr:hypothetical protein GOP47_0019643 [Adiantum capillus-veneris]